MPHISIKELKEIVTVWALELGYDLKAILFKPSKGKTLWPEGDVCIALDLTRSLPENEIILLMADHQDEWENLLSIEIGLPVHLYFDIKNALQELKSDINESGTILFDSKEYENPSKNF